MDTVKLPKLPPLVFDTWAEVTDALMFVMLCFGVILLGAFTILLVVMMFGGVLSVVGIGG